MTEADHAEFMEWLASRASGSLIMTLVWLLYFVGGLAAFFCWTYSKGIKAASAL